MPGGLSRRHPAAHAAAGLARSLLARGSGACLHAGRPWAVGLRRRSPAAIPARERGRGPCHAPLRPRWLDPFDAAGKRLDRPPGPAGALAEDLHGTLQGKTKGPSPMSAREAILGAIHAALGGPEVDGHRVAEEARDLL